MDIVDEIYINMCNLIKEQSKEIWDLKHELKELKDKVLYYNERYKDKDENKNKNS